MKRLGKYFLQGLLYVAPLGITLIILYNLLKFIDGLLQPYFKQIFDMNIPGAGVVAIFLLVTLLGILGQTIIARPIKATVGKLINRTPLLKIVYSSLKDLFSGFVGEKKKFTQPVLVRVNTISNLEKLGFLTQENVSNIGVEGEKAAVYFPHSYNFSGELFIVPCEHIKKIEGSPSEIMKFIVSGGVTVYNYKSKTNEETNQNSQD
ncbi:MAG: DUF502 domain-containing protein [Bacteroidales bacterium]